MMKKLLVVLFICVAITFSGCGLVQTAEERNRRLTLGANLQMRSIIDDFDSLILWEQPCQMSQYHIEAGY